MGISLKRLESLSLRELSIILSQDQKNQGLNKITVTEIRITNDLSFMTIFYSYYNSDAETISKLLEKNKGYLRMELAKRIKARKMPELIFKLDEALIYGNHIDDLLKSIHALISAINNYKNNS